MEGYSEMPIQPFKLAFKENLNLLNHRIRKKHDACFQGWIVFLFTSLARFGFLPFVPPIVTYYYFLLMKIP